MDKQSKSKIERYLELESQEKATQKDWESLSEEEQEDILSERWVKSGDTWRRLNDREWEEHMAQPAEIYDPHKSAYTRMDDYSLEYRCIECGYHFLDTWEKVVYYKGDEDCEHDLRPFALRPIIPIEFDEHGIVTVSTIKRAKKIVGDLLEKQIFDEILPPTGHYVKIINKGQKPYQVFRRHSDKVIAEYETEEEAIRMAQRLTQTERRKRSQRSPFIVEPDRDIVRLYREYKQNLGPSQITPELKRLIDIYNPDLVLRVVRSNAREDVVEKGKISPTSNTEHRKQYAWCLAVFKIAQMNPSLTNVPGVDTTERYSYPSRFKERPSE